MVRVDRQAGQSAAGNAPILTPEELRAASCSLWQSDQYAALAPAFFAINDRMVYEIRRPPYMANTYGDTSGYLGRVSAAGALEPPAVEAWLRTRWHNLQLPYALEMQWRGPDNEVLACRAGALLRHRVHNWVADPRYYRNAHTLHGAVGRALDVLRVVSGAATVNDIDVESRAAPGVYIPYATFLQLLKESSLSAKLKKGLPERVEWSLIYQLRHGRPVPREVFDRELEGATPEIILEGKASMSECGDAAGRPIAIDQIAVNSIMGLASRKKRSPQLMDFLKVLSRETEG